MVSLVPACIEIFASGAPKFSTGSCFNASASCDTRYAINRDIGCCLELAFVAIEICPQTEGKPLLHPGEVSDTCAIARSVGNIKKERNLNENECEWKLYRTVLPRPDGHRVLCLRHVRAVHH